jgi:hypothetical protein
LHLQYIGHLPGDLKAQIGAFIGHFNHRRY